MKIACIGGGPASLYFALLAKKENPDWDIQVYERNPVDVTWGFGVVFSDDTMEGFRDADEQTYKAITDSFVHWDDIDIFVQGEKHVSTGHGFAGMQRLKLLQIMEQRALELGVEVHHDADISNLDDYADADLIVAGDGISSFIRNRFETEFGADIIMRPNKFVWLGTKKKFDAFTFYFNENEHGLWRAHCYSYMPGASTFIVECTEETWRKAGLEGATEEETIAYCANVFASELGDEELIGNMSIWRSFPRVRNARYFHDNIVLLGDALHTAHFSIGSGTKLAMEDGIALNDALKGQANLKDALIAFQEERQPVVDSLQRAAQVSMEWFEEVERYHETLEPLQFSYALLTRSLRINHDNLKLRDPEFVARMEQSFAEKAYGQAGLPNTKTGAPPPIFTPLKLRDMELENRIVLSPMCMYSADDGLINDWHLVHLGSRAIGGAGLVYTEATAISADARISDKCAGMYLDEHESAWGRLVDFVHGQSNAKICMQLSHAGRKGSTQVPWLGADMPLTEGGWEIVAPSALPYDENAPLPRELGEDDMTSIVTDYIEATKRAEAAGFDMVEVHMAHGYLLSTFLSPLTNRRTDAYGGSIDNRMRFPLRVFKAVRDTWPSEKPMSVRISATDWKQGGFSHADGVALIKALQNAGCDIIDVSAGGVIPDQEPVYGRLFQTQFSTKLRLDSGSMTMTVGNIQSFGDANAILASGRADLCAIARMHLADPYWTRHAAYEYDWPMSWPDPYKSVERYTPRWA